MTTLAVLCPSDLTTGGPEALHQLAAEARAQGIDAKIIYYPQPRLQVNPAYRHYDVEVSGRLVDRPGVVIG